MGREYSTVTSIVRLPSRGMYAEAVETLKALLPHGVQHRHNGGDGGSHCNTACHGRGARCQGQRLGGGQSLGRPALQTPLIDDGTCEADFWRVAGLQQPV